MNSWRALFVLLLSLANGALWAQETPTANGSGASKPRIVILGDSITAGHGLDPKEAYPALLQKKIDSAGLNYTVVNAGVSGDTTAGGLRRVTWAMSQGAEIFIVALGGNDGLRGISPKQTEENLTGIIAKARAKSPQVAVFVAGMQMPDNMGPDYTGPFKEVFPKVASTGNATLIPFLLEGVGGDPKLNQADQIHPTAEGQQKIAETVWAAIEKSLKPRS